jgi:hypothetical protein
MSQLVAEVLERLPLLREMTDQHQALSMQQRPLGFRRLVVAAEGGKTAAGGQAARGVEVVILEVPVVAAPTGREMPERAVTRVGALVGVAALRQPAPARQPLYQTAVLDTHGSMEPRTAGAEEGRMAVLLAAASVAPEVEVPRAYLQRLRAQPTPEGEEEALGLIQPQQAARAAPASSSSPFRGLCDGPLR